ncbi:MAG: STAS domain-containing protein [Spirochaetia bacterium]|nr:STAS domain-containing protein [Spirochaetia bacterium]
MQFPVFPEFKEIQPIDLALEYRENTWVLQIHGPIELTNVGNFFERASEMLGNKDKIVLDMAGVRYIDSIGMGTLLDLNSRFRRNGCSVRLIAVPSRIAQVFRLCGVTRMLDCYETLESATANW